MDLVERLKELYRFAAEQKGRDWDEQDEIRHLFKLVLNIGNEAVDEIERLREENTVLSSTLSKLLGKMAADEMAENLLNHGTLTGE